MRIYSQNLTNHESTHYHFNAYPLQLYQRKNKTPAGRPATGTARKM